MYLCRVDWITVMHYCMVSLTGCTVVYSLSRTPLCDLYPGLRRRDHIRPTLLRLHWLPVQQLVLFKIAVLVYQCLNGLAPSYLADNCQLVSDVRPRWLRSSDSMTCAVRRTRTTYGDRCFAVAGPRVWNSLPTELRQSDSLIQFKRRLKTHLFGLWDHSAYVTFYN